MVDIKVLNPGDEFGRGGDQRYAAYNKANTNFSNLKTAVEALPTTTTAVLKAEVVTGFDSDRTDLPGSAKNDKDIWDAIRALQIQGGFPTVIDNLLTSSSTNVLSANQGVVLKALVDAVAADLAVLETQVNSGNTLVTDLTINDTTRPAAANTVYELRLITDALAAAIDALPTGGSSDYLGAYTFAQLASVSATTGDRATCTNLAGTTSGGQVWYDGTTWRSFADNTVATAAGAGPIPTDITLSVTTVTESAQTGSIVATISAAGSPAPTFTKVADPDNKFSISGSNLVLANSLDFETKTSHSVTIAATNTYGTYTEAFTINVTNADDTAPTITSSASPTVAENTAWSMTLTANETVTWSKVGGSDQALFTLSGATLSLPAQDYESPADSNTNNTYVVTVRATDTAGNTTDQTITLTVTNAADTTSKALVLDDDFETDPDAWTNLGVAMRRHKTGDINLVGVIVCSRFDTSPCAVRAVLDAYGLTAVPVGWTPRTGSYNPDYFATSMRDKFGLAGETGSAARYTPAAALYRQILVAHPGVRIATGGFLKPLEELRLSAADGISPLTGSALIAASAPKLFVGVGRKPLGQYGNVNAFSGGTQENNTGFDRANVSSFTDNFPGSISFYPFPEGSDFTNSHPLIHIKDTNDTEIDPLRYGYLRGITLVANNSSNQSVGPLGTNGEREAGDLPIIQAAIDDILGTPTANVAFSATGVYDITPDTGTTSFTTGGHNRHRYFRLTTAKATLETLWQGDLDALLPPTSVNYWKDSTAFGGSSDSGGVITNNNATAPDGTLTADTITGSGWGGGVRLFSSPASRSWTLAFAIKKTAGRTRFPAVGIQFRSGATVRSEAGAVINTNTGVGYAATGGVAPSYGSVACTVTVEEGATALPFGNSNRADYWVVKISFTVPSNATTFAVYLQSASGNNATSFTRDNLGGSTSQVYANYQLEPVSAFSGWLPTDGDCTWQVAA
jgi:hypothetical protein